MTNFYYHSFTAQEISHFHFPALSLHQQDDLRGQKSPLFLFLMMNNLEGRIRELLGEILAEMEGYLVDLKVLPAKVEVFADRDPHITIEDCVKISRTLGKKLDEEFGFSSHYVLEVSSPGMDQPLKVLQQYKKNFGRTVDVLLVSGVKKKGTLLYADDDKLIIEEHMATSKKETEVIQSEIPFLQIKSTTLVFNF